MKTILLLLCTGLALAPLAPAAAQRQAPPILDETDFTLNRYEPEWVESTSLLSTVSSLYGRSLRFDDRQVQNLTQLDDSLVIYETPERLERIMAAIAQLDFDPSAQGEDPSEVRGVDPAALVLDSFRPKNFQAHEFYSLAEELYGRRLLVNDSWHSNLRFTSNQGLVIYEEKSKLPGLLANLAELDASQAPEEEESVLVSLEYHPRHLSPGGMMEGLRSFQASVIERRANMSAQVTNITMASERGIILIRDYPDRAEEIIAAMKRLDQPAPQVMVSCQVIKGVDEVVGRPASRALQQQLTPLLPFQAYQVEAIGMLRASAVSGTQMQLDMDADSGTGLEFKLHLRVGAFDGESGSLSLDSCQLAMFDPERGNRDLFSTSTTVFRGEMAVLGVTGAEPLFLVVQVHPVKSVN